MQEWNMTDENSRFDKVSERARAIVTITLLEHVLSLLAAAGNESPRGVNRQIHSCMKNARTNVAAAQVLLLGLADGKDSPANPIGKQE
jgi:hypothetical protein